MKNKWLFIAVPVGALLLAGGLYFLLFGNKSDSVSGNKADQASGENNLSEEISQDVNNTNGVTGNGTNNTGNLSAAGAGYEGIKGTGDFNYGEALQKSLIFYELQRSGDLPENTRCNWRGDSCLKDGSDAGLDLTGGWLDAGDNVKFNLPMSYSAMMLGWSIYEDKDAYEESGQLEYALGNIKWANDYFIKCHPEDEVYYYQVGNGSQDHTFWGAAEVVEIKMDRPSYCVTKDNPGSTVCGETAASLAVCSIVYKDIDKEYSDLCLEHAKSLYKFAKDTKSDAGYTMADGFYNSWSGFNDELSLAAAWLYIATNDDNYLNESKQFYSQADQNYKWAQCWDDVHIGAALLLARLTNDSTYSGAVEKHLDWWTTGTSDGERITYSPKGLAWLDSWGSLRYATTEAYIAALYSEWEGCSSDKAKTYWDFAESQVNYALGSTGFSYEIGFGEDYPKHPHHRTAQGSYCDNMNEPGEHRHILYGALVGGPDANDGYTDEVSNYNTNEVACDYNAGFTGALAKMYSKYHGETIIDFGAVEAVDPKEIFVQGAVNVSGDDFVEIKAYVLNQSAWPARSPKNLEMRYYVDLSEIYAAGGTASDVEITTNYMQAGQVSDLVCQDEANYIYYLPVAFNEGDIYPGGQSQYKAELQIRMRYAGGPWDNSNDPSYSCLDGNNTVDADTFALFEDGQLIYGTEPPAGAGSNGSGSGTGLDANAGAGSNGSGSGTGSNANAGAGTNANAGTGSNANAGTGSNANAGTGSNANAGTGSNTNSNAASSKTASNENVSVNINYDTSGSNASSISGTLEIKNLGSDINLKDLEIDYFFSNEANKGTTFSCYHSAINGKGGSYSGVNGCSGQFVSGNKEGADSICKITFSDNATLKQEDTLTVNFCINYSDWSNINMGKAFSAKDVSNILIKSKGNKLFGNEP